MKISCGFILEDEKGRILICHPTGAGRRWDFPKGGVDEGESHLNAAIREVQEETNLVLSDIENVTDLGCHDYIPSKKLHLFYLKCGPIDVKMLKCNSTFDVKGKPTLEMDGYKLVSKNKLCDYLSKGMNAWINNHWKDLKAN